jgi:NAD(P)-dependent dehydrogenase (short-subunit alcohol dehydrogenase family)
MAEQNTASTTHRSVLVIGASRGLGKAVVKTYAARGAHVVATVRGFEPTPLHAFARQRPDRVTIEHVDIDHGAELEALAGRLAGRTFDLLFVVAGVSLAPKSQIAAETTTNAFERMMVTNVLSVMRTVERLQDVVDASGTIAVMSSGQGSIANNTSGGFEVYRASKAALNQLMRSYASRHAGESRALLLMAPGWVKTDMGGQGAALEVADSIPPLVDTVDGQRGIPGLRYLDRFGATVPW